MHAVKLLLDSSNSVRPLETVHDNVFWRGAAPRISVCVPAYRRDVSQLMQTLSQCQCAGLIELIVLEDGGRDHDLLARMEAAAGQMRLAIRIVAAHDNRGRAGARNAAIAHARADWILLLDADMRPDAPDFIETYLNEIEHEGAPAVIVGGYSLRAAPKERAYALHRWQARATECLPSRVRKLSPGRFVPPSNLLVHRAVLEKCPLDDSIDGWGWESAAWGLGAQESFPIVHIDNTATHRGLVSANTLMEGYSCSGARFARMAERHPEDAAAMPHFRMAMRARALPFRQSFKWIAADVAKSESLPLAIRGRALRAWRALVYAEAL